MEESRSAAEALARLHTFSKHVSPVPRSAMGLAHPVSSKVLTRHGNANFKIGAASMQGFRTGAFRVGETERESEPLVSSFFPLFSLCLYWSGPSSDILL